MHLGLQSCFTVFKTGGNTIYLFVWQWTGGGYWDSSLLCPVLNRWITNIGCNDESVKLLLIKVCCFLPIYKTCLIR